LDVATAPPTPAALLATLRVDLAKLTVDRQIERRNQLHAIETFDTRIRAEQAENAHYAGVLASDKLFHAEGEGRR
jgi:hypothetical protein